MRLEVIIPDNTRPDLMARVSDLVRRLNEEPEIAESFAFDDESDLERLFTPERLALIDAAEADARAGNVYTSQQVRDFIQQKHDAWLQTYSH